MRDFRVREKKTPRKASFKGCLKNSSRWVSKWFPLYPWSLYLQPCCTISDRRVLAKTFCLPVSRAGSFLSLIWVNDIFTRLHRRRMVHHGTSISARAKRGDWVSRLSQRVLLSICNTPSWVTLSKPLKADNLILLYGHVFVFHTYWRGRLSRSKVKKDNTFEGKSTFELSRKEEKENQQYIVCAKNRRPRMRFAWPLILNALLPFLYRHPPFIKINSRSVPGPAEKLNFSQFWFL